MKTRFYFILLFIIISCSKDIQEPVIECAPIIYTGTYNCSYAGNYVTVKDGFCCPSSSPYYCSKYNLCFMNCETATEVCLNGIVTVGQTNSNSNCTFTNYTGQKTCLFGVQVSPTACCYNDEPYYCSNVGKCFATCIEANNQCFNNVIKGK